MENQNIYDMSLYERIRESAITYGIALMSIAIIPLTLGCIERIEKKSALENKAQISIQSQKSTPTNYRTQ